MRIGATTRVVADSQLHDFFFFSAGVVNNATRGNACDFLFVCMILRHSYSGLVFRIPFAFFVCLISSYFLDG